MARICHACGSADTAEAADRYTCLECGAYSTQTGDPAPAGLVWTSEIPVGHNQIAPSAA